MATLIPAQVIGVSDELGKIAKGYRADLIAMDLVDYSTQII
jgi:N-acetylglucosamine-6-phosphate deacetylase